jgi:hypothetical protein
MNGEGCYDPPSLRKQEWRFAENRAGAHRYKSTYKPGKFARLLDINLGTRTYKANRHGSDPGPGITPRKSDPARCGHRPHFARAIGFAPNGANFQN